MRVELDKRALFALASDTRLDILKSLQPMRRTVTQLADTLGIDKAAVHRHLKTLEEGGFVKRYEDHGFVYYGLSWKSRDILSPSENTKVVILLAAFFVLISLMALLVVVSTAVDYPPRPFTPGGETDDYTTDDEIASDTAPFSIVLLVLVVVTSLAAVAAMRRASKILRRPRQPGMAPEDRA